MSDWLMRVIKAEAKHLIALAADDEELRADLRALAHEILAATAKALVEAESAQFESHSSATVDPVEPEPESEAVVEPLRELTLGSSVATRSEPRVDSEFALCATVPHDELGEIEANCRRKADAARWAAERLLRIREGNDCRELDLPMDSEMAEWVDRITDCFGWIQASEASEKADLSLLDNVGGASRRWPRRSRPPAKYARKTKAARPSTECCRLSPKRNLHSGPL